MINNWYRLNLEVVLTANKFSGMEPGVMHDGLARQIKQHRESSGQANRETGRLKFWQRLAKRSRRKSPCWVSVC